MTDGPAGLGGRRGRRGFFMRSVIADRRRAAARSWLEPLRHQAELATEALLGGSRNPETGRDDSREIFLRAYRILHQEEASRDQ